MIAFERLVAEEFEAGKIKGPIHLSGGNEEQLIEVFEQVSYEDWVFCSYRQHFHALLHGLEPAWVLDEIRAGRSMYLSSPDKRFFSSAIVAGCLPIAVGVASALRRKNKRNHVWCFVGDMAATTGAFHESLQYSAGRDLPITFVIEDNGLSCDSPTEHVWGPNGTRGYWPYGTALIRYYRYERKWPHVGTGRFVKFSGF